MPIATASALALAFWSVLLSGPIGGYDWTYHYHYYDWIRISLTQFHTLPLHMVDALHTPNFLANSISPLLGPLVWLLFFVSTGFYIKLLIVLYTAAGLLGMYWLLRDEHVSPEIALLAGIVFTFNGFVPSHLAVGHHVFLGVYLLPGLLCLFKRAIHGSRLALWMAAAFNVLVIFEGGHYPFIWQNFFVLIFSALTCVQKRSLRPASVCFFFMLASMSLGAVKLLPMAYEFRDYAPVQQLTGFPPAAALWSLTARGQTFETARSDVPFQFGSGWWEYDFYLGILPLACILVGVVMARRSWPLLLTGCFFLLITVDLRDVWSDAHVWGYIKDLPVWRSQRAPSRFMIVGLFALIAVAAVGLQRLLERAHGKPRLHILFRSLVAVVALIVAIDLYLESRTWQTLSRSEYPVSRDHVISGPLFRGSREVSVQPDEERPNRLVLRFTTTSPVKLVLPSAEKGRWGGWRISSRALLWSGDRNILDLPPGETRLVLTYRPAYFYLGLSLSLLALSVAGADLLFWRRRNAAGAPPRRATSLS